MTRFDPTAVFTIFVLCIVLLGVAYANISRQRFLNQTIAQSSPQPNHADIPTPTALPTPLPTQLPTLDPSTRPLSSNNPGSQNKQSVDLMSFKYPSSQIKSQSTTELELTSSDSANVITEWYKSRIKSLGLTTNTASATNTNNNIFNSLTAAGPQSSVKVEIKKADSSSQTTIKINI